MLQKIHLIAQYSKNYYQEINQITPNIPQGKSNDSNSKKKLKEKKNLSNINKSNDGKKSMWIFIGMLINLVA